MSAASMTRHALAVTMILLVMTACTDAPMPPEPPDAAPVVTRLASTTDVRSNRNSASNLRECGSTSARRCSCRRECVLASRADLLFPDE